MLLLGMSFALFLLLVWLLSGAQTGSPQSG
jgi:hypothetical protein